MGTAAFVPPLPTPRSRARPVLIALVALGLSLGLAPQAAVAHPPGVTERVSVDKKGTAGNNPSQDAAVSADGRFVAFTSLADNLVRRDRNNVNDVFVRDRQRGTTERVSVSSTGAEGNDDSGTFQTLNEPSISADGRFVAFDSLASNLVPGDTNGAPDLQPSGEDVFVRDRQAGTTERVSVSSTGAQGTFTGGVDPAISAGGRFVAFATAADFAPADTNFTIDVYVHDRQTRTTELVSVGTQGAVGNNVSDEPAISGDGRFVAFTSGASNLVAGDTDNASDIFVRDRVAGTTEALTVTPNSPPGPESASASPSISADGRLVAFWSRQSDLVAGDANGFEGDVYVADRQTGTMERVSVSSQGAQGNLDSSQPSISADGRFVAFSSDADNLVPGDGNFDNDVFVRDRAAGSTVRVSVSSDGSETGFELGSLSPAISADGQVIGFQSEGENLVPDPPTAFEDVYVHDESP
jgi:Tol biopolymer transport system component